MDEPRFDIYCDPDNPLKLEYNDVKEAFERIRNGVLKSDLRFSHKLSKLTNANIYLKMEVNQVTGSFKERGGRNALLKMTEDERKAGVFAASAGNHALALCFHGQQLGIPVTVVMPKIAPLMKIDNCVSYGANVIVEGENLSESRNIALKMAEEKGGKYINGYDNIDILAGAGSIGIEIMEQLPNTDAILIPVGGGGLLAGVGVAVKAIAPNVKIIGVEPETCAGFKNSLEHGKPTLTQTKATLADGLAVPVIGCNSFESAKNAIEKIITVNEEQIAIAILRLIEGEKIVSEGAGATGLAALFDQQFIKEIEGKNVVVIISGGNIDTTSLGRCVDRALSHDSRLIRFNVVISDRPGCMAELCKVIGDAGACIKEIFHERAWLKKDIFCVRVKFIVETRNQHHVDELEKKLKEHYEDVFFYNNIY
ncbi:Tryptophan synthase beta subunit-like PLP-dependent enzymes superfamily domain-containing protein [Strongyloides ratti]|uniref:L-serine deaminase n=1 Tax=Strongyloides ratti TaxID=34506 RepID=A0A090LCB3_STRRB|nr:Tryptophan synthase beta subunit-like PLP-dependent enzymes superfamily domain-containing protein [Strongyloides ratti]CEF65733.1 Tryptophan synthase beta subunit-like PLP-dependent enzymes superfamily domain-containing protein [Strongyloides ratti]